MIYYRNLTKRLDVGLSMTTKLINFSFRNKVQRFFKRDTSKIFISRRVLVWKIKPRSVRQNWSGLCRNLKRILSGKLRWNKIIWYFKRFLWSSSWIFHFLRMWLVRDCWNIFSITLAIHKLNHKAKLESLVQQNQTFTLYMKSTTTFNLWNGYDN